MSKTGALLALLALMSGCASSGFPPVTPEPTGVYHPGKFVWYDLFADDAAAQGRFYSALFGLTAQQRGDDVILLRDGVPVADILRASPSRGGTRGARWLSALSVPDVAAAARRIREAGGAVHEGPAHLRGRGTYAIVRDPFGAELVLLRADGGDPPDIDRDDRAFLWTELWADRPSEAVEFYAELTGCEALPVKGAGYWVLYSETSWRFGITHLPTLKTSPQWVPSVRVADVDAVLSRVDALGGKVLVKPTDRLSDCTSALIADPEGALLMIEVWRGAKRGS